MLETRPATANDAALITAHRKAMFLAMGRSRESVLESMSSHFEPWVTRMIIEGKYTGWVMEDVSQNPPRPIASAGLLVLDWPPHPLDPEGEHRGYILNVFVDEAHRRKGLAHSLVDLCLAEARRRRIHVVALHSSDAARPIYEIFGFRSTNEMFYVDQPES